MGSGKSLSTILQINHLQYSIAQKCLLDIDRLEINAGEFVGLLGANGAGKTTLFKTISGELKPDGQGSEPLRFHGQPLNEWSADFRARHLGVLPQASQLSFPFRVFEVVELGLIPLTASRDQADALVRNALIKTDTLQFASRLYTSLSGGERQRVQLARVLVQLSQTEQTPLLLLDEPTSAQDLGQQHQVLQLAKSLCSEEGFAVVAILHDLNQALRYCDTVWLMEHGKVVAAGQPENVLSAQQVLQTWDYLPERIQTTSGQAVLV